MGAAARIGAAMSDVTRLVDEFVAEAEASPWRRETGIVSSEEEHVVYLTNDAQDTLFVNADDAAMLVNFLVEHLSDYEDAVKVLDRLVGEYEENWGRPASFVTMDLARAALARLRESVPA